MCQTAFQEFEKARTSQLQKNEARRMRTLVNQAGATSDVPGRAGLSGLTQNAHDPRPRLGLDEVAIELSFHGQTVIYQHDGKPFSMKDLAALLSGGSNNEFESMETTGRF